MAFLVLIDRSAFAPFAVLVGQEPKHLPLLVGNACGWSLWSVSSKDVSRCGGNKQKGVRVRTGPCSACRRWRFVTCPCTERLCLLHSLNAPRTGTSRRWPESSKSDCRALSTGALAHPLTFRTTPGVMRGPWG